MGSAKEFAGNPRQSRGRRSSSRPAGDLDHGTGLGAAGRMGYRLRGAAVAHCGLADIVSDGIVLGPGDEALIPTPYWVSYPEIVKLANAEPVFLPTTEENGFKITPQQLDAAINGRTKVLILNSPSNPTGAIYTPAELAALAEVLAARKVPVLFFNVGKCWGGDDRTDNSR